MRKNVIKHLRADIKEKKKGIKDDEKLIKMLNKKTSKRKSKNSY